MGDRFFDLANFSVNHELSEAESDELLRAYFGDVDDDDRRALTLMRFMSDFREAMWGVVQQGLSGSTSTSPRTLRRISSASAHRRGRPASGRHCREGRARVVVIGGGVGGCSVAYWLTKLG